MAIHTTVMMQPASGDADIIYTARDMRETFTSVLQSVTGAALSQGVCSASDFTPAQRSAGANFSVDVGPGRGFVIGDDVTNQGVYHIWHDTSPAINVSTFSDNTAIGAPASGTRVHRLIWQVRDKLHNGAYTTYDSAPLLLQDTGSGTPAEPNSAITLALVSIAAGQASIQNSNITDYRGRVGSAWAVKSADEGRSSTTTLGDDTDLQLTCLQANTSYFIAGDVFYKGSSTTNQGIKWTFTVPSGSTFLYSAYYDQVGTPAQSFPLRITGTSTQTADTTGTADDKCVQFQGILKVSGTPGTVVFRWAPNVNEGTAVTVEANSHIRAHRVTTG